MKKNNWKESDATTVLSEPVVEYEIDIQGVKTIHILILHSS